MASPPILSGTDEAAITSTCQTHNLTREEFAQLKTRAAAAKATAYCPYSQFRVGAALLSKSPAAEDEGEGQQPSPYISGANVENASYPVGTCAERVALGKAVTGGHRRFRAIAVATDISPPASPCGMCRQFIREFSDLSLPVIMFDKNEDYVVLTLEQLLPMSFGPDALPPPGAPGTTRQ